MGEGELILNSGDGINEHPWMLDDRQGPRMLNSGFSQVPIMAEPVWYFTVSTCWLTPEQFRKWKGWIARRQGSATTFTAYEFGQPFGKHPVGSDVGLTLTAADRAAGTLSFGSTGAWQASEGDRVSYFTANSGYYVGTVLEDKEAAAGVMADLHVYPPPLPKHVTTPNPRRIRPLGEFFIRPKSLNVIDRVDERFVSFIADQTIRG